MGIDRHFVLIELTDHIPLQEWTTIIADVKDAADNPIRTPIYEHCTCCDPGSPTPDRPDRVVMGYLPADVDQSRKVNPLDLLEWKRYVNALVDPPQGVVADYANTDRFCPGQTNHDDPCINPLDLLRFKQLINGISPATRSWTNETLPCEPCFGP